MINFLKIIILLLSMLEFSCLSMSIINNQLAVQPLTELIINKIIEQPDQYIQNSEQRAQLNKLSYSAQDYFFNKPIWKDAKRELLYLIPILPKSLLNNKGILKHAVYHANNGQLVLCFGPALHNDGCIMMLKLEAHENSNIKERVKIIKNIDDIVLSPDGSEILLLSNNRRTLKKENIYTQEQAVLIKDSENQLRSISYAPDGKSYTGCFEDNTISIWSSETDRVIWSAQAESEVSSVILDTDNNSITFYQQNSENSFLLSFPSGHFIKSFLGKEVLSYNPHNNDLLAMRAKHKMIALWDKVTQKYSYLKGHTGYISSLCYHPKNNQIISSDLDNKIFIWDLKLNCWVKVVILPKPIVAICFIDNGDKLLAHCYNGQVYMLDLKTFNKVSLELDAISISDAIALLAYKNSKDISLLANFSPQLQEIIKLWSYR